MENALTLPQRWKRNFGAVWSSEAAVLLGDRLVQFALVWWLVSTTGSAAVLASASMVVMVPQILVGPIAGALIDRWNRKAIMILADATMILASGVMAWVIWSGQMQIWHIYVIMFVRSIAEGFSMNALSASTALLVPNAQLARVSGLNQMLQGGMQILAPTLGALALTVMPLYGVMTTNIALVAVAIVLIVVAKIPQPVVRTVMSVGSGPTSLWRDTVDGFRFVFRWKAMFLVMVMAGLLNFFINPTFTLLPLFVTRDLGGDAVMLGSLESAMGIGIVIGGLVLGAWGGFKRRIVTSLMGVAGMGVGIAHPGQCARERHLGRHQRDVRGRVHEPDGGGSAVCRNPGHRSRLIFRGAWGRYWGASTRWRRRSVCLLIVPIADVIGVRGCFMVAGVAFIALSIAMRFIPAVMHLEDDAHESVRAALAPRVTRKRALSGATAEEKRVA